MRLDKCGTMMQKRIGFQFLGGGAMVFLTHAFAMASPAATCDAAARFAAERTGVPLSVLRAVTLAETGRTDPDTRQFSAWPWAIQAQSRGSWFPNQDQALAFAKDLVAQGVRNLDIGCFQLNFHWHGAGFRNLEEMMTPDANALYAAGFLQQLYTETGDWKTAVGHYHSRDSARAMTYVARLETIYNAHINTAAPAHQPPEPRNNRPGPPARYGLALARGPLIELAGQARPLIGGME
jgi:hypothetical protein